MRPPPPPCRPAPPLTARRGSRLARRRGRWRRGLPGRHGLTCNMAVEMDLYGAKIAYDCTTAAGRMQEDRKLEGGTGSHVCTVFSYVRKKCGSVFALMGGAASSAVRL